MTMWWEEVANAIANLGGVAKYVDIYAEVRRLRPDHPPKVEELIRKEIQRHSSQCKRWEERRDIFYPVGGLRSGVWGLHGPEPVLLANDVEVQFDQSAAERTDQYVNRIVRDTVLSLELKRLHQHRCQICSHSLRLANGGWYSEAHHIKPLGKPHNGPDIASNIIVLCPNCHVLMDYFAIALRKSQINMVAEHRLRDEYVDYHNAWHEKALSSS